MSGLVRNARRVTAIARTTAKAAVRALLVAALAFLFFVGIGPHVFGYRVVTVLTGSMRGTANPGDLVVDMPVALSRVHVGDIITYETPTPDHHVVTHRIVEVVTPGANPTVRTQGDANNAADPWTATLGGTTAWKVRAVVPKAGTIIRFMRAGRVQMATTRFVPLLLALFWLSMIWSGNSEPAYKPKHLLST
ncbi:MAG: signal peptidase [Actinomycetota bacterium]